MLESTQICKPSKLGLNTFSVEDLRRTASGAETVVDLFERQVNLAPDSIAVVSGHKQFSYRELSKRANELAEYLRWRGIGPEALVGLYFDRSASFLIALLSVLKAGGAYLPLDPEYPKERLHFMLQDSGVELILTESKSLGKLPAERCTFCLDSHWHLIGNRQLSVVKPGCEGTNLANVIYTSGSTGRPKGVMITHASVSNVLSFVTEQLGIDRDDVLVAISSFSFDIAGLELLLPLTVGARVVIANRKEALDPEQLAALLEQCSATVLQGTPATWQMLVSSGWTGRPQLKAISGGEVLTPTLAAALLPRVESLWNGYGPTETTIYSTFSHVENERVTIGRPIRNTEVYILDENGLPAEVGTRGEIHIGGVGLARGYLGQAELTSERFVPCLFLDPDCKLYRSGDEGRLLPDGNIEYLGRKDFQVKVRGHRIELGEIESVLMEHPSVRQSLAIVEEDSSGFSSVVAFVVPLDVKAGLNEADLICFAERKLPKYMIPAAVCAVSNFPLTPNGKVDRQALKTRRSRALQVAGTFIRPVSEIEQTLLGIFEEVLRIKPPVRPSDNFFELGGHSLLAVQLFGEIERQFGRRLPLATAFEAPSVEKLAAILNQQNMSGASVLVPIETAGDLPPFFCVAGAGGVVLPYRNLAGLLGPGQPFYALQPRPANEHAARDHTVENRAAIFVEAIRTVQPHGPYRLGGWSFGGTVAFEMAQQLTRTGEQVDLVALLDTDCGGPERCLLGLSGKRLHKRWDYRLGELIRIPSHERAAWLRTRIGRSMKRVVRRKEMPDNGSSLLSDMAAYEAYAPKPYRGRVVLFWTPQMAFRAYDDNRLAWSDFVSDGLEVRRIAGYHLNMLESPQVDVLARELKKCLK